MITSCHPDAELAVEVALLDVALFATRFVEDMTAMLGCIGRLDECQRNLLNTTPCTHREEEEHHEKDLGHVPYTSVD